MRVGFLGPVSTDGVTLRPRARRVLALLGAHRPEGLTADELADGIWGADTPRSWSEQVRYCVWEIRKALGPDVIERVAGRYRLGPVVVTDVAELERLVEQAREARVAGDVDRAVAALTRAAQLWRGRPFDELDDRGVGRPEVVRIEEMHRGLQEDLVAARLDAGDHREVVADAEALVVAEPLRERRWALLALAQYRSGNQAAALRSLHQARNVLADQLGIAPGEELVALEHAFLRQEPSLAASAPARTGSCPYKGLACYGTEDADLFFGREAEVEACLRRLDGYGFLVLAGPSGCGKSSLARAGIAPVFEARGRPVAVMVPGADPDAALTYALAEADEDAVVVVDQLEEVFAGTGGADAVGAFLSRVVECSATTEVVVTVRSDHLGALGAHEVMRRPLEEGLHLVSTLGGDALRTVIEGPADAVGLGLEPGLVDLLIAETDGEPAALPLLSHALAETWDRRKGRMLTVEAYRATGGIAGAVARSAERLWERLPAADRPRLKALLLRLVAPGASGQPVRVHLDRRRLAGVLRDDLVDLLVRCRLATADDDVIGLAHDAVASAWPRLRTWVDEDQAGQRILHHLAASTDGWESLGRPESELYRGARLETAVEWIEDAAPDLTVAEREFIAASQALDRSQRAQLEAVTRTQALQNRRLRLAVAAVTIGLAVAIAAGIVAVGQRGEARRQQRSSAIAALTSESAALRTRRRDVAALLALEAHRLAPSPATESALFGLFTSSPHVRRTVPTDVALGDGVGVDAVYLPGGEAIAMVVHGRVVAVDLATGVSSELARVGDGPGSTSLALSDDGSALVAVWAPTAGTTPRSRLSILDAASRTARVAPVELPIDAVDLSVAADGSHIALGDGSTASTWIIDADDGVPVREIIDPKAAGGGPVRSTFLPSGGLAIASPHGDVRVVDPVSGTERFSLPAPPAAADRFLDATADGTRLVMVGTRGVEPQFGVVEPVLSSLDLASGAEGSDEPAPLSSGCASFRLVDTEGTLRCADAGGLVLGYDLVTGRPHAEVFDPQQGDVCAIALDAERGRLGSVSSCRAGTAAVVEFAVDGGGAVSRLVRGDGLHRNGVLQFGFEGEEAALVVELAEAGREDPVTNVVDARTGEVIDRFPGVYALIPTDEPTRAVAISGTDGAVGWYDTDDRKWVGTPFVPELELNGIWARSSAAFVGGYTDDGYRLGRLDLERGRLAAPIVDLVGADIWDLALADDEMYAAGQGPDGPVVERRSLTTGEVLARSAPGYVNVAAGGGVVVASTSDGQLDEVNPATLRRVGRPFPGISGPALEVALDERGQRLMVHGEDRRLRVYDVASRIQLGDALLGAAPRNEGWSAIRPDGAQVAFDSAAGAVIWDLDVTTWRSAACRIAGRDLTRSEWAQHLGGLGPYRRTCS